MKPIHSTLQINSDSEVQRVQIKGVLKIAMWFLVFLSGVLVGFVTCLYSNGYERVVFAFEATKTEKGARIVTKLENHKNSRSNEPLTASEVLGYVPLTICVQPPYMGAAAFRHHLKANLIGFRMANDSENLLWIVGPSSPARYISINRLSVADIDRATDGKRCIDGKHALFQPTYVTQQLRLILKEKQ